MIMRVGNLINFLNPAAPKGLIRNAARWVEQYAAESRHQRRPQPNVWRKNVHTAEDNIRLLTRSSAPTPQDEYDTVRWTVHEGSTLYCLKGCRVLGAEGAVISPDNRVFADFTLPPAERWLEHACFKRRRMPPVKKLKGWYATIAWPEARFFFHWMVEALPRMAALGEYAKVVDGLFVPSPLLPFHRRSLELLGFDESRLIPLDAQSHFQPEHLFVPHTFAMYNPPRWMHRWYKDTFLAHARALAASGQPARRIYISRADAPVRRVTNEEEVMRMLGRYGFTSVELSALPFEAQARLFHDADVIVAPHGAGLSNMVFAREDTHLIEAMAPRWMAPCFMALAMSAGCRYRYLVAEEIALAGGAPQRNDIRVPVDHLERLVRAALK
jgi:capsular polysaccharide biosynthesis protein